MCYLWCSRSPRPVGTPQGTRCIISGSCAPPPSPPQADYNTGHPAEDQATRALVKNLVYNERLMAACPVPFDEGRMWRGQDGPELKALLQVRRV